MNTMPESALSRRMPRCGRCAHNRMKYDPASEAFCGRCAGVPSGQQWAAHLRSITPWVGAVAQGLAAAAYCLTSGVLLQQGCHRGQDVLQHLLLLLQTKDLQLQMAHCGHQGTSLHFQTQHPRHLRCNQFRTPPQEGTRRARSHMQVSWAESQVDFFGR